MNYAESLRIHDDAEQAHTLSQPPLTLYADRGVIVSGPYRGQRLRAVLDALDDAGSGEPWVGLCRPWWRLWRVTVYAVVWVGA